MAAPKRVAMEIKKARGTNRKDRVNSKAPKKVAMVKDVPEWLDEVAASKFVELKAMFVDMRILSQSDCDMLAKMCDTYSNFLKNRTVLQEEGFTYTTTTTQGDEMKRPRPEYAIMQKERDALLKMMSDFGMSPASRQRVSMLEDDNKNPLSKI